MDSKHIFHALDSSVCERTRPMLHQMYSHIHDAPARRRWAVQLMSEKETVHGGIAALSFRIHLPPAAEKKVMGRRGIARVPAALGVSVC